MTAKLLATLAATLALVAGLLLAATLVWEHPSAYVDGSPLPVSEIRETRIEYGRCSAGAVPAPARTLAAAAPATSATVAGLTDGEWCFRAVTAMQSGEVSEPSNTAVKRIVGKPQPPVIIQVDIQATATLEQTDNGLRLVVR